MLADDCGFTEAQHPHTQTTQGASPWERVPDLLHAHGFCSHGDWFAYRHALRTLVADASLCPMRTTAGGSGLLAYGPSYIGGEGLLQDEEANLMDSSTILMTSAFLDCNTSTARWPWVHQRFDGADAATPQTMVCAVPVPGTYSILG